MSTNGIQQSTNPYRTSTNTYTNDDGLMEKEQIVKDRATGRIIKKSVWVDKNNNGTFDTGELTSVTIFGYTQDRRYATSRTFKDANGDGYYDPSVQIKYYKKLDTGIYAIDYKTSMSDTSVEEIETMYSIKSEYSTEFRDKILKDKEKELKRINIQNKNDNYKKESDFLSNIMDTEAYYYDTNGHW